MITPAFGLTATERVLPKLALDFTTAALDARVTVTRTTNATNPATYINSSGVITAATNNQPRFDYDPVTLLCKGLLIEESRANSLLNTDLLATQIVTVTAAIRTLSFYGTGTVTLSGTHTAVVSGTGTYPTRATYSFTPSAGVLTLTVTGTVQFAQLEAGAFATSYIPTTTTSLTRNADAVSMTGTNFSSWYNAAAGSAAIQFDTFFVSGANRMFSISDNTTANRFDCRTSVTSELLVVAAGSTVANLNADNVSDNTASGAAIAYALNNFAIAVNGGTAASDPSGAVPTVDRLYIGADYMGASFLNGHVQTFRYWPQALTTAELSAFSKRA